MNSDQASVLASFVRGNNVKVSALPGAGKSFLLFELAKVAKRPVLLLAYNTQLATEMKHRLDEEGIPEEEVTCCTFHSLASKTIHLCRDDHSMREALSLVHSQEAEVKKLSVSTVLVDEAQDMRETFVELMDCVLDREEDVQYCIASHPPQMIYDYDSDDPASTRFVEEECESTFPSTRAWSSLHLHKTHRLTPQMCKFVSCAFEGKEGMYMESIHSGEGASNVRVKFLPLHTASSYIHTQVVKHGPSKVLLLTPTRRGNWQLTRVLNDLSDKKNVPLHVHGVDSPDPSSHKGKLRVRTWHSSKGTEAEVTILFGAHEDVSLNPLFVAMTRAKKEMHILLSESDVHPCVIKACLSDSSCVDLLSHPKGPDKKKWKPAFEKGAIKAEAFAFRPKKGLDTTSFLEWSQEREGVVRNWEGDNDNPFLVDVLPDERGKEDVSSIYLLSLLACMEHKVTGMVRKVKDVNHPSKMDWTKREGAILSGHCGRFVSPYAKDEELLPSSLRSVVREQEEEAYDSTPSFWCDLACCLSAWNGLYHTSLQKMPCESWVNSESWKCSYLFFDSFLREVEGGEEESETEGTVHPLRGKVHFDVVLTCSHRGKKRHCRLAASSKKTAYHFVYDKEIGSYEERVAVTFACFHPLLTCKVVNLATKEVKTLCVDPDGKDVLLDRC